MNYSEFKFCPKCKSQLTDSNGQLDCKNCGAIIYKNSAPTAGVLIVKGNKVLLAKRAIQPFKDKYDIVGGFLKYGEDPISGAIREVKEETDLDIKITHTLGAYIDTYGKDGVFTLNMIYIGEILSGKIEPHDDVGALEWFEIDILPEPAFKSQKIIFKDLEKWYSSRGGQN